MRDSKPSSNGCISSWLEVLTIPLATERGRGTARRHVLDCVGSLDRSLWTPLPHHSTSIYHAHYDNPSSPNSTNSG